MPFTPTDRRPLACILRVGLCSVLLLAQSVLATPLAKPDPATLVRPSKATLLIQSSPLAGSQYHALPDLVSQIRVGDSLTLKREPTNTHDANAIQVLWQDQLLGFVPRRENKAIARAMDRGEPLVARVVVLRPAESPWRRLRFEVSVPLSD
jgi:hypothetical protein